MVRAPVTNLYPFDSFPLLTPRPMATAARRISLVIRHRLLNNGVEA